jgi:hypothetical protein
MTADRAIVVPRQTYSYRIGIHIREVSLTCGRTLNPRENQISGRTGFLQTTWQRLVNTPTQRQSSLFVLCGTGNDVVTTP